MLLSDAALLPLSARLRQRISHTLLSRRGGLLLTFLSLLPHPLDLGLAFYGLRGAG